MKAAARFSWAGNFCARFQDIEIKYRIKEQRRKPGVAKQICGGQCNGRRL
jgi:hypothetical protein